MRSQRKGGSDVALHERGRGFRDFDVPGNGGTGDTIRRGRGCRTLVARKCDRPLEQDEMKLASNDGERHFQVICDALLDKGDLAGYAGPVRYPVPGE